MSAVSAVLGLWQDRDPLEALVTAQIADELAYPELWIGEMATFDAFALAAAVGARTDRIELTVGPLAVGVRDPMMLARGTASVGALIGGRPVHLALGASSRLVVEQWHGRPHRRMAAHLRETALAVRPLLAGDKVDIEGELARTRGYRLRVEPPRTSITIAAFGPHAVAVAARHADRMVLNLVTVEGAARLRERLDGAAATAGVRAPRLALWVPACVDPTDAAIEQMTRAIVPYLSAHGYAKMFTAAGFGELVELARTRPHPAKLLARLPREVCRAVGLVGSVAEAHERAAAYYAAGIDELALVPATADDPGGRRTLGALRSLGVD